MVEPDGAAARLLEDDGWQLDAGRAHAGQGTRNGPLTGGPRGDFHGASPRKSTLGVRVAPSGR